MTLTIHEISDQRIVRMQQSIRWLFIMNGVNAGLIVALMVHLIMNEPT